MLKKIIQTEDQEEIIKNLLLLYNVGKFSQITAQEKILKTTYQHQPIILNILGATNLALNKFENSVIYFKKVVTLSPNNPDYLNNLGIAYHHNSNFENAIISFRKALKINPNFADAYCNLGISLKEKNNHNEAIKCYKNAIKINPYHAGSYNNLGEILYLEKKFDEARASFKKAIGIRPDFAEAFYNLGIISHNEARHNVAILYFKKAIQLKSDYAEAYYHLGNIFKDLGQYVDSEKSYNKAITLKPDFAEAYNNLGTTINESWRMEEAEDNLRRAIVLKPNYAEAYSNLGAVLTELGRFEEAEASFSKSIDIKPNLAQAHRHLTTIKKYSSKDEQFLKMQDLYFDESISDENLCHINFGLAKAYEDLGNFEQAFMHYGEGNALRKKHLKYDVSKDIAMFKLIKASYPAIYRNSLDFNNLAINLMPIFIVGMPRSGTSLVEQIISSHKDITGAGELPFVNQFGRLLLDDSFKTMKQSLIGFRENYLKKLKNFADGNLIITDKMPHNFLYLGLIIAALPEAKIIHVKRSPSAVCWANYKQYFESKSLNYSYSLDDVINYYRLYEDLMDFWSAKLSKRIYKLDYENLTVNHKNETHSLIDYLGLCWDEKCLSPQNNTRSVATASNIQVRKKIYLNSSQKWKKYEPFLDGKLDDLFSSSW